MSILLAALRAVKLLATFISNPSTRDTAIFQVKEWLTDPQVGSSNSVRLTAATMFAIHDNVPEAIKLLGATSLEQYVFSSKCHRFFIVVY
jgi:hypothetical protein